jgi:nicotinamidase-related amidase
MKTALILIDLQNDFFRTEYEDQNRAKQVEQQLTENINRLLDAARPQQIPVFFVITSLEPDASNWNLRMKDLGSAICIKGTRGEEILPGLKTTEKDRIIHKTRYSAFFDTNLHEILKSMSIDSLIIGGINTHACIRTSAVDAFMRDYQVIIPEECVASYNNEYHHESMEYFSQRIAAVLPLDELIQRINKEDLKFTFSEK